MKAACYCGTRNVYEDMMTAMNSLLKNSDVDRVYLLIEDDTFPYRLPNKVETINVSGQQYFRPEGINFRSRWTWMVLMRCALHRVLPELDKVLSLDIDTIVDADISELWDIDLDDYYLAAVKELHKSVAEPYINAGVMMLNLEKLRDGTGDKMIDALNSRPYGFCDQDVINEHCKGHIYLLPSDYNVNCFTAQTDNKKIYHFAGIDRRKWNKYLVVQTYKSWQ